MWIDKHSCIEVLVNCCYKMFPSSIVSRVQVWTGNFLICCQMLYQCCTPLNKPQWWMDSVNLLDPRIVDGLTWGVSEGLHILKVKKKNKYEPILSELAELVLSAEWVTVTSQRQLHILWLRHPKFYISHPAVDSELKGGYLQSPGSAFNRRSQDP